MILNLITDVVRFVTDGSAVVADLLAVGQWLGLVK